MFSCYQAFELLAPRPLDSGQDSLELQVAWTMSLTLEREDLLTQSTDPTANLFQKQQAGRAAHLGICVAFSFFPVRPPHREFMSVSSHYRGAPLGTGLCSLLPRPPLPLGTVSSTEKLLNKHFLERCIQSIGLLLLAYT